MSTSPELHKFAREGKVKQLRAALQQSQDPNGVRRDDRITPLYLACWHGELECVEELLLAGAEVDAPTRSGWTPLFAACNWGFDACAKALLKHDPPANVDHADRDGVRIRLEPRSFPAAFG